MRRLGIQPIVGARVVPEELFLGPSSDPVEIRVFGPGFADMKTLRGFADRVKNDGSRNSRAPGTSTTRGAFPATSCTSTSTKTKRIWRVSPTPHIAQTLNAYYSRTPSDDVSRRRSLGARLLASDDPMSVDH